MTLTRDELKALAETRVDGACVSLFMPTEIAGPAVRQNPIRLKDLIADARRQIVERGFSDDESDAGLKKTLPHWGDPLVLAGTEENVAAFRATSKYPKLVAEAALGSPDGWDEKEIHERTWPLVEPLFLESRRAAAEKFPELRAHGRGSDDLRTVLRAAFEGRVAELFIAVGASSPGLFDPETTKVEIHREARADDQDLVDETAVQTLLHDGVVYAIDGGGIPGAGPVAANFRYPLHERRGKEQDPGDVPSRRRAARS